MDPVPRAPWSRALVVGASSGIGASLVRQLTARGVRVAGVARRAAELEKLGAAVSEATGRDDLLLAITHDVTNLDEIPGIFHQTCDALGGMDLVIYAAGIMPPVAPDEYDTAKDKATIDVNLTGAIAWLNEAGVRFGDTGTGTIVGIGSMQGERGRRGNPGYAASKAGLATYLESLRNRGLNVVTIKPGFIDTVMTRGRPGVFWLISADDAARLILDAAARGPVTAFIPRRWQAVSIVLRAIPSAVFRRLPI